MKQAQGSTADIEITDAELNEMWRAIRDRDDPCLCTRASGRCADHEDLIAAAPRLLAYVEYLRVQVIPRITRQWEQQDEEIVALTDERDRARRWAVHLEQGNARALELHSEYRIYEECGHDHAEDDDVVEMVVDDLGPVCQDGYLSSICRTCCAGGGEGQTSGCVDAHDGPCWPCATRRALDGQPAGGEGVSLVCGCGVPPDGAPGASGCSPQCMLPEPGQPADGRAE